VSESVTASNRSTIRRFCVVLAGLGLLGVATVWVGCVPLQDTAPTADPNTAAEPNYTFGCVFPSEETFANTPRSVPVHAATGLPSFVDLTKSTNRVPPITDQKHCGSCVGFANAYCLATYLSADVHEWDVNTPDHQGSPAYLLEKCYEIDGHSCCAGVDPNLALGILVRLGTASLQDVPYSAEQAAGTSCPTNSPAGDAANFRIGSYHAVDPNDRHAIKSELSSAHVVSFAAHLYTDFSSHRGDRVYYGNGTIKPNCGHAMALVGYDESRGAYRLMNSWGTGWGDHGFMWIAYETWEKLVKAAYVAEPLGTPVPPEDPNTEPNAIDDSDDGAGLGSGPVSGYLLGAFQYAHQDHSSNIWRVYLVFQYVFNQPVFIRTVTLKAPEGSVAEQTYNMWCREGYVHFVRADGHQWQSGTYDITFDMLDKKGNQKTFHEQASVAALAPSWRSKAVSIMFRGKAITATTGQDLLPEAGLKIGVCGANLQPATVIEAP